VNGAARLILLNLPRQLAAAALHFWKSWPYGRRLAQGFRAVR